MASLGHRRPGSREALNSSKQRDVGDSARVARGFEARHRRGRPLVRGDAVRPQLAALLRLGPRAPRHAIGLARAAADVGRSAGAARPTHARMAGRRHVGDFANGRLLPILQRLTHVFRQSETRPQSGKIHTDLCPTQKHILVRL